MQRAAFCFPMILCTPAFGREAVELPTISAYGGAGLLDMRSARFLPDGFGALSVSIKNPDDRIAATFQALPWAEVIFRYSINYGGFGETGSGNALYDRSFDLKIRLLEESSLIPQVAFGMQDIVGTGVYSGEYFVASKRIGPVDLSVGIGWGRLASRETFSNPLTKLSERFATRDGSFGLGGVPTFTNYFRGPSVGVFAGVEIQTPIDELRIQAEYSSDTYSQETAFSGIDYDFPVNAGLTYRPWPWLDLGVSYMHGSEFGVRLAITFDPSEELLPKAPIPLSQMRSRPPVYGRQAERERLENAWQPGGPSSQVIFIDLSAPQNRIYDNTPRGLAPLADRLLGDEQQLGVGDVMLEGDVLVLLMEAGRNPTLPSCAQVAAVVGPSPSIREIAIVASDWSDTRFCAAAQVPNPIDLPINRPPSGAFLAEDRKIDTDALESRINVAFLEYGLRTEGVSLSDDAVRVVIANTLYRRDAEALARAVIALSRSAPPHVQQFHIILAAGDAMPATTVIVPRSEVDRFSQNLSSPSELWRVSTLAPAREWPEYADQTSYPDYSLGWNPLLVQGYFDPDEPFYLRAGVVGHASVRFMRGLRLHGAASVALYDTFGQSRRDDPRSVLPHVRSDTILYKKQGKNGIEALTLAYEFKAAPDIYMRAQAGILEEMFAGVGGEILYRPFGERWALGMNIWRVRQRDYDKLFNFRDYEVTTGHATLYYQLPWHDISLRLHAGRYLAGDYGVTVEAVRTFDTGIEIGAWFTLTDVPFEDFGEGSFDKGIRIKIPLDWTLPFPTQSIFDFALRIIQRDGGQMVFGGTQLYDRTSRSSYGELARQWVPVFGN